MSGVHDIELEIHPIGKKSRVSVDGKDIPADRVVVTMDVREMTTVEIRAFKMDGAPYTIKGILLETDAEDAAAAREFVRERQLERAHKRVGLGKP